VTRRNLFPYPLPETLGIGTEDPLDYRWDAEFEGWRHEPGWWQEIFRKQPPPNSVTWAGSPWTN